MRKKPCGLLETRVKIEKSEKNILQLVDVRLSGSLYFGKLENIGYSEIIHKLLIIEKKFIFNFHTLILYCDVRVKKYFAPNLISTNCSAAKQLSQFSNIRNPLIYCINRYFFMFGGSQVQKSYRAGTNDFLTFCP